MPDLLNIAFFHSRGLVSPETWEDSVLLLKCFPEVFCVCEFCSSAAEACFELLPTLYLREGPFSSSWVSFSSGRRGPRESPFPRACFRCGLPEEESVFPT